MKTEQYGVDVKSDVNGREGIVSVRRLGKAIIGRFWRQGNIRLRFEVDDIEGRGDYWRSRFEDGTDLVSPSLTLGVSRSGSCQGRTHQRPGRKEGVVRKGYVRRIPASRGSRSKLFVP